MSDARILKFTAMFMGVFTFIWGDLGKETNAICGTIFIATSMIIGSIPDKPKKS